MRRAHFFALGILAGISIGLVAYWMLDLIQVVYWMLNRIPGRPFARRPAFDDPLYPDPIT